MGRSSIIKKGKTKKKNESLNILSHKLKNGLKCVVTEIRQKEKIKKKIKVINKK